MKNIIADIAGYISDHTALIAEPLWIDMIPTETGDAVMIRAIPGNPVETRYLDGSRDGQFPFSLYCRSNDGEKAYDQLCDLLPVLDLQDVYLTNETLVTIVPTSNPSLVQKTEGGDYTYTAGFRLNYFTERS